MIHEIDDIMQYYYMNFISVYCLYIIIILSSIFSLKRKRNARKYLLYSTVAEIGICSNLFMGFIRYICDWMADIIHTNDKKT